MPEVERCTCGEAAFGPFSKCLLCLHRNPLACGKPSTSARTGEPLRCMKVKNENLGFHGGGHVYVPVPAGDIEPRRCLKQAKDYRSMWVFGLHGEEFREATRCRRVTGHRGPCSVFRKRGRAVDGQVEVLA